MRIAIVEDLGIGLRYESEEIHPRVIRGRSPFSPPPARLVGRRELALHHEAGCQRRREELRLPAHGSMGDSDVESSPNTPIVSDLVVLRVLVEVAPPSLRNLEARVERTLLVRVVVVTSRN